MNAVDRFNDILRKVPSNVKIVAISKTRPIALIDELYTKTGHKVFGENRVQELELKHNLLPADINWHLIGHLQSNKLKFIAPYIAMIQSVDSFKLLLEINSEGIKCKRIIPCLLQFYIATEESKFGFTIDEVKRMLDEPSFWDLMNIDIQGVMGIATYSRDNELIRREFKTLYSYFNKIKTTYFDNIASFREISVGMTNDYELAIQEGSTIVRIGSGIFGEM